MQIRTKAMALGGALGLALNASSAGAQEDGLSGPGYYGAPTEVIVTPPPMQRQRSVIGAPIIDVSMSRPVRIDDLDLRTSSGVDELRGRISYTARTLCRQLDVMYPVTYDGSSSYDCYRIAFRHGMARADDAIRAVRGTYAGY